MHTSKLNKKLKLKEVCYGGGVIVVLALAICMNACSRQTASPVAEADATQAQPIAPILVTEMVAVDSDDPAIWVDSEDPARSLVLGTDKGGSIFVFDLEGKIVPEKTVTGMGRMNNIDVAYGFELGGEKIDIAMATDRDENKLRVFRVPEMTPIDNGGIEAFEGQDPELRRPMGLALYTRPSDGAFFAIVSRKTGPSGAYLWQYRIEDDGAGAVRATKVREFGSFSGLTAVEEGETKVTEIEAIAVDNELGYLYYSDEWGGVKKYLADPDAPDANTELAVFGTTGFTQDREGISIYKVDDTTGYILVSDQQGNRFRIFPREGIPGNPHEHPEITSVLVSTNESDGSESCSVALNDRFPAGIFVAMSDDKTFQYYSWEDIAGDTLMRASSTPPLG